MDILICIDFFKISFSTSSCSPISCCQFLEGKSRDGILAKTSIFKNRNFLVTSNVDILLNTGCSIVPISGLIVVIELSNSIVK